MWVTFSFAPDVQGVEQTSSNSADGLAVVRSTPDGRWKSGLNRTEAYGAGPKLKLSILSGTPWPVSVWCFDEAEVRGTGTIQCHHRRQASGGLSLPSLPFRISEHLARPWASALILPRPQPPGPGAAWSTGRSLHVYDPSSTPLAEEESAAAPGGARAATRFGRRRCAGATYAGARTSRIGAAWAAWRWGAVSAPC